MKHTNKQGDANMTTDTQTAWQIEQVKYEIARLQGIIRNPQATNEEKRIAHDMLKQYQTEKNTMDNETALTMLEHAVQHIHAMNRRGELDGYTANATKKMLIEAHLYIGSCGQIPSWGHKQ